MEEILIPGWALILMVSSLVVLFAVMLLVYMPRAEEILRLRRKVQKLREQLERTSKGAVREHDEHVADVGELTDRLMQAQQQASGEKKEHAEEMASERARTEQQKQRAEKIARLYEDLKRSGGIQIERN